MKTGYRFLAAFTLLLIAGCAPFSKPGWESIPQADELFSRVRQNSGRVTTLDAAAKVGLTVKGKYFSSQQFLLLQRPDHLRADVLTGFGQLILQLASDGQRMAVFMNNTVPGRFLSGPASYENLSRFVRIPLEAENFVSLLLYDPPVIGEQAGGVAVDGDRLMLTTSASGTLQRLYFDRNLELIGCAYLVEQREVLRVEYERIDDNDHFPRTVRIELPDEETRMTIHFKDVNLNTEIAPERFQLDRPANSIYEALP